MLAQATKAKFPEAGPFHQALKTRGARYFLERRAVNRLLALTVDVLGKTWLEHGVRYRSQDKVRAALGSHVRWLKRMGQPLAVEAV